MAAAPTNLQQAETNLKKTTLGQRAELGEFDQARRDLPSGEAKARELSAPGSQVLSEQTEFIRGQAQPIDVFTQFEQEAGLPEKRRLATDLRGQVFDLEDTISRVKGTVEGTSRESLLTQSQKDQLIREKKQPLLEQLGEFTTNLGRLEQSINISAQDVLTKTSLVREGVDRETQLFQSRIDFESEKAARLQTGFTQDIETSLEFILAKIKRGQEISDQERAEAFAWLTSEREFKNTLIEMREQEAATGRLQAQQGDISSRLQSEQGAIELNKMFEQGEIDLRLLSEEDKLTVNRIILQGGINRENMTHQGQIDLDNYIEQSAIDTEAIIERFQVRTDIQRKSDLEQTQTEALIKMKTDMEFYQKTVDIDTATLRVTEQIKADIDFELERRKSGLPLRSAADDGNGKSGSEYLEELAKLLAEQTTTPEPLQQPQLQAPAGTEVEWPKGSGTFWTATAEGGWK